MITISKEKLLAIREAVKVIHQKNAQKLTTQQPPCAIGLVYTR